MSDIDITSIIELNLSIKINFTLIKVLEHFAEYLKGIGVPVRQAYGNSVGALRPIVASKVVFDRYILSKNTLDCKIEIVV